MLIGLFRIRILVERQSDAEQLECVSTNQTGARSVNEPLSMSAVINGSLLPCTEHHITVCLLQNITERKGLKNDRGFHGCPCETDKLPMRHLAGY